MPSDESQQSFFRELDNVAEMLNALEHLPDALFMVKDRDSRLGNRPLLQPFFSPFPSIAGQRQQNLLCKGVSE